MRRGSRRSAAAFRACCRERTSYVLQDDAGQISLTHQVSAGLDYASVGPEHAMLHDSGRATYVSCSDDAALKATVTLSRTEGILPALESAHAVAEAIRLAPTMAKTDVLMVNLSGRGDKDMGILARELDLKGRAGRNANGQRSALEDLWRLSSEEAGDCCLSDGGRSRSGDDAGYCAGGD